MSKLVIHGTSGSDHLTFTATGAHAGYWMLNGGERHDVADVTELVFDGGDGDDLFTLVNPDGGLFAADIRYDAGGQAGDGLEVLGGVSDEARYVTGATRDSGVISRTLGDLTQTLSFSGIAPITDTTVASNYTVTATTGADAIVVSDAPTAGLTRVAAASFELVDLSNKANLTISGNGGADSLVFNNPNPATGLLNVFVTTLAGPVTQTGSLHYQSLSFTNTGAVSLTGPGNNLSSITATLTVAGAAFSYRDADALTVSGILTTTNGAATVTTDNGALTVTNSAFPNDVNLGTGALLLSAGSTGSVDNALTIASGTSVTATGGVIYVGDNIVLNGSTTVAGATGLVMLRPSQAGTFINIGGADAANTLGLTSAEVSGLSGAGVVIGSAQAGDVTVSATVFVGTNSLSVITGGAIIDGSSAGMDDLGAPAMALTAVTGIGVTGAQDRLEISCATLDAVTTTGGIGLTNDGGMTIGGVNGATVRTSGLLSLLALSGGLTLAGSSGAATLNGGSLSGDISAVAAGASSDIVSTVNQDAADAAAGNASISAGRDILLGVSGSNFNNGFRADWNVYMNAVRDVVIDGATRVASDDFGAQTGGGVTISASRDFRVDNLHGNTATVGAAGTAKGSVSIFAANVLLLSSPHADAVFSTSGSVTLAAARMMIASTSGVTANTAGASVTLTGDSGTAINLGSTTDSATNTLELADAELDRMFTPTLHIGKLNATTTLTVSNQISSQNYTTLTLAANSIVDGTAGEQTDVVVDSLAVRSVNGVGGATNADLDVQVSTLSYVNTTTGLVNISNQGSFTIGQVDGILTNANTVGDTLLTAVQGSITVAAEVIGSGFLNLSAPDAAGAQDIVVAAGARILNVNAGYISLSAGDTVTVAAGATLQSINGEVQLICDASSADAGIGGVITVAGAISVASNHTIGLYGQADDDLAVIASTAVLTGPQAFFGSGGADTLQVLGSAAGEAYSLNYQELKGGLGGLDLSLYSVETITLNTGAGDDRFSVSSGVTPDLTHLNFDGGAGADVLSAVQATYAVTAFGGTEDDVLRSGSGADMLSGDAGNDTLTGGAGADTLNGGAGTDTADYSQDGGPLGATINLLNNVATDTYGAADTLVSIENAIGSAANDTIFGSAAVNVLDGSFGDDVIFAGDGGDVAHGGLGNDTLVGNSQIFVQESDQLFGDGGNDTLYAENVDVIDGGLGFDSLIAINAYDFTLNMATTSIEYAVMDFGNDTITAATQTVGVSVFASGGNDVVTGSAFGDLIFAGVGNDIVAGGNGDDAIVGEAGIDQLDGGAGDDRIYFDAQDSFISGGTGYDAGYVTVGTGVTINMGASSLEFFQDFAGGADTVLASSMTQGLSAYAGGGNDGVDGSNFADIIFGEAGNDTLSGNDGADVLVGGVGTDTLSGGLGIDALYGGAGDGVIDTFKFAQVGAANADAVYDFVHGIDKLDLSALSTSFAALTISSAGGNAIVSLGGQQICTVVGAAGTLTAGDFVFSSPDTAGPDLAPVTFSDDTPTGSIDAVLAPPSPGASPATVQFSDASPTPDFDAGAASLDAFSEFAPWRSAGAHHMDAWLLGIV